MSNTSKTDSDSKRVLFITPQPFLADRGSPLRVKSEIESLSALGYEIDVLCFPYGTEYKNSSVTLHRSIRIPGISEPAVGPSWQKIVLDIPLTIKGLLMGLRNKYDVIHGVEEAGFIAAAIGTIRKVPYIVDMHSLLPDQLQYSGFLSNKLFVKSAFAAYNWSLKKASGIVAVCQDVQDYASIVAPEIPCTRLEDLPLDSSWETDEKTQDELIARFNLKDKTILTYTGNFSSYQGIPLLLHSFKKALESGLRDSNVHLLMVGESNQDMLTEVKNEAQELGIADRVIFTGELPSNTMGSIMGISDALISPRSKGSNTPLKLYCYMASGKPIVATSICSHTQALTEDAAYLAEPSPEQLAQAIIQSLETGESSKKSHEDKANRAKEILSERFNKETFTASMGWLYERVTNAPLPVSLKEIKNNKTYQVAT